MKNPAKNTLSTTATTKIQKSIGDRIADFFIYLALTLLALVVIIPFYNMLLVSIAKYSDIVTTPFYFYPKSIDFQNYRMAFLYPNFKNAAMVSVFVTAVGTTLNMIMTTLGAYTLSRRDMPFRKFFFYFIVFTMFFGAGLIPWYLVMKGLGLVNSVWAMILPPMIGTFNLILMRNYFLSIPESLEESARIDGANDLRIMIQVIIPVATPIIATVALFYAVDRWNEWWLAMLFIQDSKRLPLQLILRRMVVDATIDLGNDMMNAMRDAKIQVHGRSLQMATVTITTIPIMIVYPFLQKYFTKGIMLGAIKA